MKYKRLPLGPLGTNTYLVWGGDGKAFLVDPAGDLEEGAAFVKNEGLSVEKILLTHGHLDHTGGVPDAVRRFKAPLFVPEGDSPLVVSPDEGAKAWMGYDFDGTRDFTPLKDGDSLKVGELKVTVISTPGHTAGSTCYLAESADGALLLSGDTLFARSVGRTDLPGGDWGKLEESLLRLASLPDSLVVLPGHGPETTIGEERRHNPFWPEEEGRP